MRSKGIAMLAAAGLAMVAYAPAAVAAPKSYTVAQVAKHATAASCWSIVGKSVYDLTKFIPLHPGGPAMIKSLCGKNGTAAFTGQHSGQSTPATTLAKYRIGALKS